MKSPTHKLVMTLLVRDEMDIVRENVEFHLRHGVDFLVVTDNGSTDGTREYLAGLECDGIAHIIDEPEQNYAQAVWVTRMAHLARERFGADWILHNDADEFWVPASGDLKTGLKSRAANVIACPRWNMLPTREALSRPDYRFFHNRLKVVKPLTADSVHGCEQHSLFLFGASPKVLTQATGLRGVAQGNHIADMDQASVVTSNNIHIWHYPIRSYEQFERKVINGGASYARNTELPAAVGWHWRRWYQLWHAGKLREEFNRLVPSDNIMAQLVQAGHIELNTRLERWFLAQQQAADSPQTAPACEAGKAHSSKVVASLPPHTTGSAAPLAGLVPALRATTDLDMDTMQILILEVGEKCNLGKIHPKCPTMIRPQNGAPLTDDKIIALAIKAYEEHHFQGLIGWHFYNEPTLQIQRILALMERIRERVPASRFLLWSNGTIPCDDPRMAMFSVGYISDYFHNEPLLRKRFSAIKNLVIGTPVFDARMIGPVGKTNHQRCLRPLIEMPVDAFGSVHICCQDWKGEIPVGNVWSNTWEEILANRMAIMKKVCGTVMADDAPDRCLRCAGRVSSLPSFDDESKEKAVKWLASLEAAEAPPPAVGGLVPPLPRELDSPPDRQVVRANHQPNSAAALPSQPSGAKPVCLLSCFLPIEGRTREWISQFSRELGAQGLQLVLLTNSAIADLGIPIIRVPFALKDFATRFASVPSPSPCAEGDLHLAIRDRDWDGPRAEAPAAQLQGLAGAELFFQGLIRQLKPAAVIPCGNTLAQSVLLMRTARLAGVPVFVYERGLLPGTLMVDQQGHCGLSDLNRSFRNHRGDPTPEEIRVWDLARGFYRQSRLTKYAQAAAVGESNLRQQIGAKGKRLVVFLGQHDAACGLLPRESTESRLHSPCFGSTREALLALRQAASRRNDCVLVFKPHPMDRENYDDLAGGNFRVMRDVNLHSLLEAADVHAAMLSTVQFEALFYERPCLLLARSQLAGWDDAYEVTEATRLAEVFDEALAGCDFEKRLVRRRAFIAEVLQHYLIAAETGVPAAANLGDLAQFIARNALKRTAAEVVEDPATVAAELARVLECRTQPGESLPELYVRQAGNEAGAGNVAGAERILKTARELFPFAATVAFELADLWSQLHRHEDAVGLLREQLQRTPADASLYTGLGIVWLRHGDKSVACEALADAYRLDPANMASGKLLASVLIDLNCIREAVSVLRHLSQLDPSDKELLGSLAICCAHAGEAGAAVEAYQRLLQLDPANATARQALQDLTAPKIAAQPIQTVAPAQTEPAALAVVPANSNPAPQISIVIPVYGNLKYTTMCLEAISRNTPQSISYEIIVVDDASSDGTHEFLQAAPEFYPCLRSVRLNENSGFSRACNAGAAAARGELVLFLNNDTEPCAGWLEGMLGVFAREPLAGVVGSLLIFPRRTENADEPDRVQHLGMAFNARKEALHLYKFCLSNQPFVRQTREYQTVTGACMMLPSKVFTEAGGFSNEYLNGGEDLDLCFKVRAGGRKVMVATDSVVRHHESATVKSGHSWSNANYRRFLERWGDQVQPDEEKFYQADGVATSGALRIAMVTPLRPLKTGVADYVEELLPALARHARVDFFTDNLAPSNPDILQHHLVHCLEDIAGADWTYHYDAVVYHIGNNRFHGEIYKLATNRPGVVVLHEYDCRGCGSASASRVHLRGLLRRSQAVIVHNEHSRQLLGREFPELPATVIPHLLSPKALHTDTPEIARARLGLPKDAFVIASLGLVQLHKRNHVTLEAFAKFSRRHPQAVLLLAGEVPEVTFRNYLNQQISEHGLKHKVCITGWLSDQQFFDCLSAADVTVNLRYPARGEESGSLTRILGCGKPAIVSNFAQFADIPDDCVIKISFDNEVEELLAAWEQLLKNPAQREARSARARDFYRTHNDVERVASLYAQVCREASKVSEAVLQLRQRRYQFAYDTSAKVFWEAPVCEAKDQSRPLILALNKLKVPVRLRVLGEVGSGARLIHPDDHECLDQLTRLKPAAGFVQVYGGMPAHFQRAAAAVAAVALVQHTEAAEIAAWAQLPVDEFWAVSDAVRSLLVAVGVDPQHIILMPTGVPALSYGATVNELRPSGLFRFLCSTDWSQDSGWEATLRAFLKEFGGQPIFQLMFKPSLPHRSIQENNTLYQQVMGRFSQEHPEFKPEQFTNVTTENASYAEDLMPAFYSAGNALVQPTLNGVGRRAVLEAAALGLPVITTAFGQLEPRGEQTTAFIVRTPVKNSRASVDETHLRQLMRQLVTERLESQLPGIRARQHILATRTWELLAEQAAIRLATLLEVKPVDETNFTPAARLETPEDSTEAVIKPETMTAAAAPILSRQIRWQSPIFDPSGYADESRYLLRSLQHTTPVRLEPIARLSKKFYDEMDKSERADLERLIATPLASDYLQLTIAPAYALKRDPRARYAIGRTTFETDRLPADWVAACNAMDEIWVPTAFNLETFRRAGVTVPLHIVPQGVDTTRFHPGVKPLRIAGRRHFAFLSVFEWIHRKGWDVLLRAWAEAFQSGDQVCLLVRSYLPNVTEGKSSTNALNERIDAFLQKELGKSRAQIAPIILLGEQLAQLDMPRLYASADAFVLPTRGEGWGRPYIEAMACGLPVIGTRWGAQLAFMHDQNSLLLDLDGLETVNAKMEFPFYHGHQWARPSATHLAKLLRRLAEDPLAAKKLGKQAAADVREKWNWAHAGQIMRARLAAIEAGTADAKHMRPVAVSWEGSFLDHGSLSQVNRNLIGQLKMIADCNITCVANGAPMAADAASIWPELAREMVSQPAPGAAVTVRHAWPPNWKRPATGKLAVIQPWEFGSLPQEWVRQARDVDEFWIPSEYVRRVYVESGVPAEKVFVVPNGVDAEKFHPQVAPMKLATQKKFKFLFVGGTIGRKGPDLLLQAYRQQFTAVDDVCLIIKDFGGQSVYHGQTFEAAIRTAQSVPNGPEIVYLNEEWPPESLPGLYTACDCLVLPYRGEGFGLPVLEAMACGLPVIITAGGATDDFVRNDFAYRIPAVKQVFGREVSGMPLVGDGWLLEPNLAALGERMRQVFDHPVEARERGQLASRHAHQHYSWKAAAAVAAQRIRELAAMPAPAASSSRPGLARPVSAVAQLGQLAEARELLTQRDLAAAWAATLTAIGKRPFHPEAHLLLAEIALAAGAGKSAKQCAQRARDLAPGWSAVKQFLCRPLKGDAKPEWLQPSAILNSPSSLRLSVCLIVKNEEQFLAQCLKSVRGFATQLIVVDTGSTDRTVEIAREFGAEIYFFAWCDDFAAARNAALEHATGDWVLMLDADEELPEAQHAKLLADMKNANSIAFRLPLVNAGQEIEGRSFVPRLFRNVPGACFTGRIHEQVFSSLLANAKKWGLKTALGSAELRHHGYTKDLVQDRNKVNRNLKLLRAAIEENPTDVNLQMNLGLELVRSDDLPAGVEKYRHAYELMSAQRPDEVVPELREVLLTQFTSQLYKVRAHEEVVEVLQSRLAQHGGLTASLHFALGLAQFELKQFGEAADQMRQCLAKRKQPGLTPINTDILTAAPAHCLALCLARLGDPAAAEKAFVAALAETGHAAAAKLDYAQFLLNQDRHVDALHQLHSLVEADSRHLAAWRLGGETALGRPEFLEFALDWTAEAFKALPENPVIAAQRAEALLLNRQPSGALPLWEKIWSSEHEPRTLAAVILCEVATDQPAHAPNVGEDERATSLAFVEWYQKLIAARAKPLLEEINARVDALSQTLPTAAEMLQAALTEAAAPLVVE